MVLAKASDRHEKDKQQRMMSKKTCPKCKEPIKSEYVYHDILHGEVVCEKCYQKEIEEVKNV